MSAQPSRRGDPRFHSSSGGRVRGGGWSPGGAVTGIADRAAITLALGKASLRSEFQYRANAISSVFAGLLFQITGFVVVWIIVDRFNQIGGWSLHEMTFLYGMRLTS